MVSGTVLFRLGRAMAAILGPLERILAAAAERGVFAVDDPDFMAKRLYTQVLGSIHFARVGVGMRESHPPSSRSSTSIPSGCVRRACRKRSH
jgi:hypothetical protein